MCPIERGIKGAKAQRIRGGGGIATRVLARLDRVEIKIETSPVTPRVVHDPESRPVSNAVADEFGYAEMEVVSFEDSSGKAPRGCGSPAPVRPLRREADLRKRRPDGRFVPPFLIYIASSSRPAHELLAPNLIDLGQPNAREFEGMTRMAVELDGLLEIRKQLVADIQSRLDEKTRRFLLGLHDGKPDFGAIDRPQAAELPAVRWKLLNLGRLSRDNPEKHARQREELETLFG